MSNCLTHKCSGSWLGCGREPRRTDHETQCSNQYPDDRSGPMETSPIPGQPGTQDTDSKIGKPEVRHAHILCQSHSIISKVRGYQLSILRDLRLDVGRLLRSTASTASLMSRIQRSASPSCSRCPAIWPPIIVPHRPPIMAMHFPAVWTVGRLHYQRTWSGD